MHRTTRHRALRLSSGDNYYNIIQPQTLETLDLSATTMEINEERCYRTNELFHFITCQLWKWGTQPPLSPDVWVTFVTLWPNAVQSRESPQWEKSPVNVHFDKGVASHPWDKFQSCYLYSPGAREMVRIFFGVWVFMADWLISVFKD